MRVGARASTRSGIGSRAPRPIAGQDVLSLLSCGARDKNANLPEAVDGQRVEGVAEVAVEAHGNPVKLQDALDDLRLVVAPGPVDDGRYHDRSARVPISYHAARAARPGRAARPCGPAVASPRALC